MKKLSLFLSTISLVIGAIGCAAPGTKTNKYTIVVVPKGTTHPY